jgi:hypothetical protein
MGAITIRGIDNDISNALREKAKKEGASINSVVLRLVRESLGLKKKKRTVIYTDLDQLAGTWDKKDYAEFQQKVADFEKIDKKIWK